MRIEKNFNLNWLFHKGDIKVPRPIDKGPVYTQAKIEHRLMGPAAYNYVDLPRYYHKGGELKNDGWTVVDLPHDFIVQQDNDKTQNNAHGYFKYDNGWYRKRFTLEEELKDKRITLQFGGITGCSEIYLNGCLVGRNFSSYNSFEVDITNNAYFDKENVLAVYTNNEDFEGWWYQGGGIYRNVKLVITDAVSIDLYGVYAPYKKLDDNTWQINYQTTLRNDGYEDVQATVKTALCDKQGRVVAEAEGLGVVPLRDKATLKYSVTVKNPLLWDIESPNLYYVKTRLLVGGEELDENQTHIGFRTVELDPNKGMFLNGKHVKVKGVCSHHDFGLAGLAMPDNIAKYRVKLLKEMGANGFRTAHYQHPDATMDALDEMGFIVVDECRWFSTTDEAIEQLTTLVKRDRNRPSVVFWSTSNEEKVHLSEVGRKVHRALYQVIKKLDDTRFITVAQDSDPVDSMVYDYCDSIGINYRLADYDEVHKKWPDKPIAATECAAAGTSRDWHFEDTVGRVSAWDSDINDYFLSREKTWKHVAQRDYVIGLYQWVAFDHRGEAMWPTISSKSGSFDIFLQKKGGFYINKAHWTDEPMVHILPHWSFKGLEGTNIKVTVYTNCDELELFLNGESLGRKKLQKYDRGEWDVIYVPGTLSVKGYRDGKLVATDERSTTGTPTRLSLKMDVAGKADGSECALFTCQVLDENSNPIPTASERVKFFTDNGATIIGTGSDNCDHVAVTCDERKMYMGKISVAVRAAVDSEGYSLFAQSDSLGYCRLDVKL